MNSSACADRGDRRWQRVKWFAGRLIAVFALGGALSSCDTVPLQTSIFQHDFKPDNVFVYPPKLSLDFQRVAVLPLAATSNRSDLADGCEALTPVLWEQLIKSKKFEVVAVDADRLRSRTGRAAWTGNEVLPPDFLAFLRLEYGCDGVLFAELTAFNAYAPLAVGWRFKLVDARTGQIIWAADEVFDAARPTIANAAYHFEKRQDAAATAADGNWVVLNSPRRFGRYSAAALLDTLPDR
jgi:hypothetical protein